MVGHCYNWQGGKNQGRNPGVVAEEGGLEGLNFRAKWDVTLEIMSVSLFISGVLPLREVNSKAGITGL